MINEREFIEVVDQLQRAGGLSATSLHDLAHAAFPFPVSKRARIQYLSAAVAWGEKKAQAQATEDTAELLSVTRQALLQEIACYPPSAKEEMSD